ncbi:MAG: MOSC domain-containing protein [Gammaproteobacteria bacterium]|uniref:MOSC N-terminal beta barrel domain-containing protein n=1 Tax=Pseudomaricurvus alcaniphilus TaxID=1166482 RepID=UPI001409DE95|nr:MOSC domain-containing protein [Gammaproteobacteria bacterium]NHN37737.1 MOSC domain-containing protein [Pseudomaricurvus alcaniphilus]
MTDIHIEQITLYPVKSLRGITVQEWQATPRGLAYDRQWMLVLPNGRFVSQRQLPQMALVDTAIEDNCLHLGASGRGSVALPLPNPANADATDSAVFKGSVWRDDCDVIEASRAASAWLNRVLRPPHPLRLVTLAPGRQRPAADPARFGRDTRTRFADAAPYLIANTTSLVRLNQQLALSAKPQVDMRRFRPNLVVAGIEAFGEQQLRALRHPASGLGFALCDPCERCIITTIDPDSATLAADREPFHTLLQLNPLPSKSRAAAFGVNATLLAAPGKTATLRVGDPLLPEQA